MNEGQHPAWTTYVTVADADQVAAATPRVGPYQGLVVTVANQDIERRVGRGEAQRGIVSRTTQHEAAAIANRIGHIR